MVSFPRVEPLLYDSTSITTYLTCPRKYFYRIVCGFVAKAATPPYFAFGSAYHKFREVLDQTMMDTIDGRPYTESEAFVKAITAAKSYAAKHLKAPEVGTKFDFMTPERLQLSCTKAFEVWLAERKKFQILAAEQIVTVKLPHGTFIHGKIDRLINWNGRLWVWDYKTTSKLGPFYERSLEPNDQFTRYIWIARELNGREPAGLMVDVLFNSKKEGPKFQTMPTSRTKSQLEMWVREHKYWEDRLEENRKEDFWPMNPKGCMFCEFHSVCRQQTESGQMTQLRSYFKVKAWDPTNTEEDNDE
jgi:CRISPR/Cas system-associated exonuclease Cas4 (RecB family)